MYKYEAEKKAYDLLYKKAIYVLKIGVLCASIWCPYTIYEMYIIIYVLKKYTVFYIIMYLTYKIYCFFVVYP